MALGSPALRVRAFPRLCRLAECVEYLEGAKGVRRTRTLILFPAVGARLGKA